MSKNTINEEVFENIIDNYLRLEESITNELHFQVEHGSSLGAFRELVWKNFLKQLYRKNLSSSIQSLLLIRMEAFQEK